MRRVYISTKYKYVSEGYRTESCLRATAPSSARHRRSAP